MVQYAKPLARLVGEFEKLPGIGPKSAQRLAFYVLRLSDEEARALSDAITEVKARIGSAGTASTSPTRRSARSAAMAGAIPR
jgi:recombinational DNA repair protein RecR